MEQFIVYILYMGTDVDGLNIYHLFYSESPEDTFGYGWADKPAGLIPTMQMTPNTGLDAVSKIKTDIKFDLAQDSSCFSMQDCRDHCVALASENLDEATDYPEPLRVVIQYGTNKDEVERMLARRGILTTDV